MPRPRPFGFPEPARKRRSEFPYELEAPIVPHGQEGWRSGAIFLPSEMASKLPFDRRSKLRIRGELGRAAFTGAWQPRQGGWFLMVSRRLRQASGYEIGDLATLRFQVEPEDSVDVPAPLESALLSAPECANLWRTLTPGRQRALSHLVSSAKTPATSQRRAEKVLEYLRGESSMQIGGKSRK